MTISEFRLERYLARYEFSSPYVLCASDCESLTIEALLAMQPGAAQSLAKLWLGYTEPKGDRTLRQEIASTYRQIEADDVLVFAGAEEAVFVFMNVALASGDHAIVHAPGYQSLHEVARSIGCEVTLWETRSEEGWELDLNVLRSNLRPNTKVVVVNMPHNPTGYLMDRAKWDALVALSQEHGFLLFSDEVYRGLEYNDEERLPALCECDGRGVSLGVMSKAYGLAGLRIGWISTRNQDLYQRLLAFKDYTTICSSAPSEFLATIALQQKETILERNRTLIRENLLRLNGFFQANAGIFDWQAPKAGPIAFPALRNGGNAETFCETLVQETGVLLLPGAVFGPAVHHFRVGFGRANLPTCLEHLQASKLLHGEDSR